MPCMCIFAQPPSHETTGPDQQLMDCLLKGMGIKRPHNVLQRPSAQAGCQPLLVLGLVDARRACWHSLGWAPTTSERHVHSPHDALYSRAAA